MTTSSSDEQFTGLTYIQDDNHNLLSETYEEFIEAVDILYIRGNISGRLKFLEAWPVAAHHIFDSELIDYDCNGVQDVEHRASLEVAAEERRIALLEKTEGLQDKSVDRGSLVVEYVQGLVEEMGRDLALMLYSHKIVDRFIPPEESEEDVENDAPARDPVADAAKGMDSFDIDTANADLSDELLEIPEVSDDMQRLNDVNRRSEQEETKRVERPVQVGVPGIVPPAPGQPGSQNAQAQDESPSPEDPSQPSLEDDPLDAIKPIAVNPAPEDDEPEALFVADVDKPEAPEPPPPPAAADPQDPSESGHVQPNQWQSATPKSQEQPIENDAMKGIQASQKMTFVPASPDGDNAEPEKPSIPVIGDDKKPSDESSG